MWNRSKRWSICSWMGAHNEQTAKQQFYTSLERTGAGYFDYYLLHALQAGNYKTYDKYHIWDFVKEQKAKGLIRHWGFSFHATPDILDELLTTHPDAEFVQLQLNYADWENPDVTARENYEVARRHGKSIPCTACHYCTAGCPKKIAIPQQINVITRLKDCAAQFDHV